MNDLISVSTSGLEGVLEGLRDRLIEVERESSSGLADRVAGLEDKLEELDLDSVTSRMDDLEQALEDKAASDDIPDFDDMESRLRDVEDKVEDLPGGSNSEIRLDDLEEKVEELQHFAKGTQANASEGGADGDLAAQVKAAVDQVSTLSFAVTKLENALNILAPKVTVLDAKANKTAGFFEHLRRAAEILLDR